MLDKMKKELLRDEEILARDELIYGLIKDELTSAREKFPETVHCGYALVEEVGELVQAMIQRTHEPCKGVNNVDILAEAVQVAAMAIRLATEGEPGISYDPESAFEHV